MKYKLIIWFGVLCMVLWWIFLAFILYKGYTLV